jgi:hypothetical protein
MCKSWLEEVMSAISKRFQSVLFADMTPTQAESTQADIVGEKNVSLAGTLSCFSIETIKHTKKAGKSPGLNFRNVPEKGGQASGNSVPTPGVKCTS